MALIHRALTRHCCACAEGRHATRCQSWHCHQAAPLRHRPQQGRPAQRGAALGPQAILGLSINTLAQLRDAPIAQLDYVGLGPIFATASKQDHARPIGFEGLAELVRACPLPSVAIGGLKAQHAAQVSAAGAQGMAVISAICGQPDPYRAALAFRAS